MCVCFVSCAYVRLGGGGGGAFYVLVCVCGLCCDRSKRVHTDVGAKREVSIGFRASRPHIIHTHTLKHTQIRTHTLMYTHTNLSGIVILVITRYYKVPLDGIPTAHTHVHIRTQ